MTTDAELDELVEQIKDDIRSGDVGPNIMCRQIDKLVDAITALRQERDMHYNRVASLLFSDALKEARTTCEEVRQWESEYINARAENEKLRALLARARKQMYEGSTDHDWLLISNMECEIAAALHRDET